ncbi:unnamed protein product [Cuscuta epithymum]|uniref:Uncharacterized protein n=1 Tax=Cuscuta epithymum TaxID=186058 RepID=A0AAV0ECX4_9ASTE|nr:unnamed protein product [Cuscuta epithymum]
MLCFPGGSSLMVSYLNNESPTNPPERPVINLPEKNYSSYISQKQDYQVTEGDHSFKEALNQNMRSEMTPHYGYIIPRYSSNLL